MKRVLFAMAAAMLMTIVPTACSEKKTDSTEQTAEKEKTLDEKLDEAKTLEEKMLVLWEEKYAISKETHIKVAADFDAYAEKSKELQKKQWEIDTLMGPGYESKLPMDQWRKIRNRINELQKEEGLERDRIIVEALDANIGADHVSDALKMKGEE